MQGPGGEVAGTIVQDGVNGHEAEPLRVGEAGADDDKSAGTVSNKVADEEAAEEVFDVADEEAADDFYDAEDVGADEGTDATGLSNDEAGKEDSDDEVADADVGVVGADALDSDDEIADWDAVVYADDCYLDGTDDSERPGKSDKDIAWRVNPAAAGFEMVDKVGAGLAVSNNIYSQ
jgi:hypothetical protein